MKRTLIVETVSVVIVLGAVVLLEKPDVRQALAMRVFHVSKEFCQANADFWQYLATSSAQAYNAVRL